MSRRPAAAAAAAAAANPLAASAMADDVVDVKSPLADLVVKQVDAKRKEADDHELAKAAAEAAARFSRYEAWAPCATPANKKLQTEQQFNDELYEETLIETMRQNDLNDSRGLLSDHDERGYLNLSSYEWKLVVEGSSEYKVFAEACKKGRARAHPAHRLWAKGVTILFGTLRTLRLKGGDTGAWKYAVNALMVDSRGYVFQLIFVGTNATFGRGAQHVTAVPEGYVEYEARCVRAKHSLPGIRPSYNDGLTRAMISRFETLASVERRSNAAPTGLWPTPSEQKAKATSEPLYLTLDECDALYGANAMASTSVRDTANWLVELAQQTALSFWRRFGSSADPVVWNQLTALLVRRAVELMAVAFVCAPKADASQHVDAAQCVRIASQLLTSHQASVGPLRPDKPLAEDEIVNAMILKATETPSDTGTGIFLDPLPEVGRRCLLACSRGTGVAIPAMVHTDAVPAAAMDINIILGSAFAACPRLAFPLDVLLAKTGLGVSRAHSAECYRLVSAAVAQDAKTSGGHLATASQRMHVTAAQVVHQAKSIVTQEHNGVLPAKAAVLGQVSVPMPSATALQFARFSPAPGAAGAVSQPQYDPHAEERDIMRPRILPRRDEDNRLEAGPEAVAARRAAQAAARAHAAPAPAAGAAGAAAAAAAAPGMMDD